jgi:hypothetical protein
MLANVGLFLDFRGLLGKVKGKVKARRSGGSFEIECI